MTSIALAVFTVAIVYVIVWSIKNEDARSISDQTGFIKMRDSSQAPGKAGTRFGRARHAAKPPRRSTGPRQAGPR